MSYHKQTIASTISDIDQSKVYLPALQRKFVWGRDQITTLFDSLMRNYPIGSFLFWRLQRQKAESYVFYEFLKKYDVRYPYNERKQGAFTHPEIIGVLDGQQRLSSMYVGLMGTHTEKAPYKRWDNNDAFQPKKLYLDLLSLPYCLLEGGSLIEDKEQDYNFEFLTEVEAKQITTQRYNPDMNKNESHTVSWFLVGRVLSWSDDPDIDFIVERLIKEASDKRQKGLLLEHRRSVIKGLRQLHKQICERELINYFEVAEEELEDILKIFVRVNSGGTVLTKTDLLFSTIVATWDDGREKIENLEQEINGADSRFNFGNEYLMRACLMLTDAPVAFQVRSFKSSNVTKIRSEWPQIAKAIKKTVGLLKEYGYNGTTLTSQNATLLLAYYIFKGGRLDQPSIDGLCQYLVRSLALRLYGSSQDSLLTSLRNALRKECPNGEYELKSSTFEILDLLQHELPNGKSLHVGEDQIQEILSTTKGHLAYSILSMLYKHLRLHDITFHQDHMHPHAGFSDATFDTFKLSPDEREVWLDSRDKIPNLQLLRDTHNQSKSDKELQEWVGDLDERERTSFLQEHYFPEGETLEFSNFLKFYDKRSEILAKQLASVFMISK